MLRHRALALTLASLAVAAGCNSGGGGPSKRSQATAGVNSATTGFLVSSTPLASPGAVMNSDVVALALSLGANGVSPQLQGITLRASGTVDESVAIGSVRLVGDDDRNGRYTVGEPVLATAAAPAFTADDGSVTLTLANPITISSGASLRLLVVVDATAAGQVAMSRIGQTVALSVDDATAIQSSVSAQAPFPLSGSVALGIHDHLLISELVGDPTAAEFVEIFNPTGLPVDLTNVYFTDADDLSTPKTVEYYFMPTGANYGPDNTAADFMVRFPAGATIAPGACITMATDGTGFMTTYGKPADYATRNPAGGSVQMLTSTGGNVWTAAPSGAGTSLFPSGEPIVLFTWDGQSDLVKDLDYIFIGTKSTSGANDPHDKSAIQVDGPDADTTPSVYLPDTPAAQQATARGTIIQRIDFTEGSESRTGGNGLTGHDETSENVDVTFVTGTTATPGTP